MISKYYGMTNVTPKIIGDYMAENTHSMYLDFGAWMNFLSMNGLKKTFKEVPMNVDSIRKEIKAGNPMIAKGNTAFGAKRNHWVVIVGVSEDGRYLILNDPSATERGKAGRPSPASELGNKINGLWALRDAS
jgi:hypothetical protein